MNLTRINIVLAVLLVLTSFMAVSMKVDHTQPNIEFLPNMVHSPAYHAYAANPVFANGRTLQAPVPGTIPRGDLPLYYTASKEDAVRAGLELKNPFALDAPIKVEETPAPQAQSGSTPKAAVKKLTEQELAEAARLKALDAARLRLDLSIERGTEIYNTFCITCHGPSGAGDGPVTKRGFPPPPPLTTGKSTEMKDGQLFHILTYGQGSMAPMISQLTRNRRWDVINYVRTMQKGAAKTQPQAEAKPDSKGDKTAVDPKAKAETKPKAKESAEPAPKTAPKTDSKPAPKAESKAKPKVESKVKAESKPNTKPGDKPKAVPKTTPPETKEAKPEASGKTPKAEEKKP